MENHDINVLANILTPDNEKEDCLRFVLIPTTQALLLSFLDSFLEMITVLPSNAITKSSGYSCIFELE